MLLIILGETEVEPSSRLQILDTGDLLIAAVKETDAGQYTCVRANEAGEVRGSAHLQVLGGYTTTINMHSCIEIKLNEQTS